MSFQVLCAAVLVALTLPTFAETVEAQERIASSSWIERPWEISYVIFIDSSRGWNFSKLNAIKNNMNPKETYLLWNAFFDPVHAIQMPDLRYPKKNTIPEDKAVVVITFDKKGYVTSPNNHPGLLRGRLNENLRIVLSEGDAVGNRSFPLGQWFLGHNEDTPLGVTPALCGGSVTNDMPNVFSSTDGYYIYGDRYKLEPESVGIFGCREWTYQMQSSNRPYIDVTSYVPKPKKGDKTPYKHGTYIGDVVGWGNFGIKKPVIGKHADSWYCLYDCPHEDAPGKIEDIKVWAERNGWRAPKPPTRMPVFVDNPRKRGTYPE